jgi:CelD/BcsL family acetyltransferase involved in cellulose biosynthesis
MNHPASYPIELEVISDVEAFLNAQEEWNSTLAKSKLHNPFLRHEWLASWWKGYGKDKGLYAIRFRLKGETVGFAPLMKYQTKLTGMHVEAIGFICNHWTRMDFILVNGYAKDCLEKLCEWMSKTGKVLILAQMDRACQNYVLLKKILSEKKRMFCETEKLHAYIPLLGTWEEYFQGQSHNFRMDSRRKLKRLEKEGPVSLVSQWGENGSALNKIEQIAQNCWQTKENVNIVTTTNGRKFYEEVIHAWKNEGVLDFSILQIGDTPIAYMLGIKQDGCYFAFDTAFDRNFEKFSPGMILHNLILEKLYQEKINCFDFGYVSGYKKRWSEETIKVSDLTIFPSNLPGLCCFLAYKGKERIQALRKESKND